MVLTVNQIDELKVRENGFAKGGGMGDFPNNKSAMDLPVMSITTIDEEGESEVAAEDENITFEVSYTRNYWEDEDDIYQEFEELDFESLPDHTDTRSIASDDSFYPPECADGTGLERTPSPDSPEPISFYKACCNNNSIIVKIMIRQGVTEEEVVETDKNRRSGLIAACYHGYIDVVMALSQCPYVDVNWQDNEGNTALITAAQAGHAFITNFLLNYFPGLDLERRNCHGFTALMKAAMQGRTECVRTLMLAGADVQARDGGRGLTPREWALFTGRHDTANFMNVLMARPCAEQFCDSFPLEWPLLEELVAEAEKPKPCWKNVLSLVSCCHYKFYITNKISPVDDGVLEHMVRATTSICSPFIATAAHTVSPGSPPCIGKRRYAVQEILKRRRLAELKSLGPERLNHYKRFFQNSRVQLIPRAVDRRASLQPQLLTEVAAAASSMALRRASLLPLHLLRRASVRPGLIVPKVRLCKASNPNYKPDKVCRSRNKNQLQVPKWDYKMKKVERKQEEEKNKLVLNMKRR
ncbi:ankyrin repeat domain-containing protein 33B [Periophthalmus magnuspinnatus]|uniref:ankyrin repeat domain-containing protein 33B n=1 Tax=Periophthalmus magnuspinnatus TaxID=409849 RepID=UPI00145B2A31|nr:ankyrin repeat domain-containing protein 33B [Periophthalmus magnuspinnatus]